MCAMFESIGKRNVYTSAALAGALLVGAAITSVELGFETGGEDSLTAQKTFINDRVGITVSANVPEQNTQQLDKQIATCRPEYPAGATVANMMGCLTGEIKPTSAQYKNKRATLARQLCLLVAQSPSETTPWKDIEKFNSKFDKLNVVYRVTSAYSMQQFAHDTCPDIVPVYKTSG